MINKEVVQTNSKKATNFGLSVSTGGQQNIFMPHLQQKGKNVLIKIPLNVCNCK